MLHSAKGLFLSSLHAYLGAAVLISNAAAGGVGGVWWLRGEPSIIFWYLLRAAQATVAAQVVLGLLLVARGDSVPDGLHIAYGVAPLLITLVSEGMRLGVTHRELEEVPDLDGLSRKEQRAIALRVTMGEMGVMTVGTLLILTLSLRAMQTGG